MTVVGRESRDALVDPPPALSYRTFPQDSQNIVIASGLGGLIVIQRVGEAATKAEAMSFYSDESFGPWYMRAVEIAASFTGREIRDFSFSFLWHDIDSPADIEWRYVRLSSAWRPLVIEATLVWCLAQVVDDAIRGIPLVRAAGQVDRSFVSQALDLFALGNPRQVWTNHDEITVLEQFYDSWRLRERITESRSRFDQAASGFSFYWEAAERRRETTLTLALAVVAVVGLLQADTQLQRITGLTAKTIDWAIVGLAALLVAAIVWRAFVAPSRSDGAVRRQWKTLADRMAQP
jgi:hypothetical protein